MSTQVALAPKGAAFKTARRVNRSLTAQIEKRAFETAIARYMHDARPRGPGFDHMALCIEQIATQRGRAPVEANQRGVNGIAYR